MTIADKIKILRKERGLTLADLSQKSGISISFLSDMERGRTAPSIKTINKIALFFNVPPASFLGDEYEVICPNYIEDFIEEHEIPDTFACLFRVLQADSNYPKSENLLEAYLYLKRLLS
jgi:transcriptional regulator with XRE-family HTH domain